MEICSKFTGEHPCQSVISIKILCNFIEITLRHGCSPVNLLYIFRTPFSKNTSGRLLLNCFVSYLKFDVTMLYSLLIKFGLVYNSEKVICVGDTYMCSVLLVCVYATVVFRTEVLIVFYEILSKLGVISNLK